MIRRGGEMVSEIREKMRGGRGKVEIRHIFKKEELRGRARLLATLSLEPNSSIGFHTHEDEEEVYFVLRGTGIVSEGEGEFPVGPGDAVLTGGGAGHGIRNNGHEPLELVSVILLFD